MIEKTKEQHSSNHNLTKEQRVFSTLSLGSILFLAYVLRIYDLGKESYWVDEVYTLFEAKQPLIQILNSGRLDQPPSYYIPFHLWIRIFGDTEISTRFFSVVASLISILIIYLIGRELFSRGVGLTSAFLMAISAFQITYSQEARFYTFFELSTLLSFYFFILALSRSRKSDFALYCVTSIVMFFSHTYGIFVLVAQGVFFLLQSKKYRNLLFAWLATQAMILIVVLPYLYLTLISGGGMTETVSSNVTGISPPSLLDPLKTIYRFMWSSRRDLSWGTIISYYAAAALVFVFGTFLFVRRSPVTFSILGKDAINTIKSSPNFKSNILLLSCWLLIPIALPFILSFIVAPIFRDRYAICATPALYLLLAVGIFNGRKITPIFISLSALAIMIFPGLQHYYETDLHQQWREAANYVNTNANQDEIIIFAGGMGTGIEKKAFEWYFETPLLSCSIDNELVEGNTKSQALNACISGHDRFWVIIRESTEPSDINTSYRSFFLNEDPGSFHLITEQHFIDIFVYLFERPN